MAAILRIFYFYLRASSAPFNIYRIISSQNTVKRCKSECHRWEPDNKIGSVNYWRSHRKLGEVSRIDQNIFAHDPKACAAQVQVRFNNLLFCLLPRH